MTAERMACGVMACIILVFGWYGPMPQLAHYHDFADQTLWLGVQNGKDVWSNLGLVAIGLYGLTWLGSSKHRFTGRLAAVALCLSILLTGLGSAYYHVHPTDVTLVWDRLPIAMICVSLLAVVYHHLTRKPVGLWLAWGWLCAGLSVLYWQQSGDLRPYLALQLVTMLLLPLWLSVYQTDARIRRCFAWAVLFYAIAKITELADHALYHAMHQFISGHTLKHLFSTVAMACAFAAVQQMSRSVSSADARQLPNPQSDLGVCCAQPSPQPPTPADQIDA